MTRTPGPSRTPLIAAMSLYVVGVAGPLVFLFANVATKGVSARPPRPPAGAGEGTGPQAAAPGRHEPRLPPVEVHDADGAPVFPDLALAPLDGGPAVRLSSLVTAPSILHLWSLKCDTCADEWPGFSAFESAPARGTPGKPAVVSVIVVPDDDSPVESARSEIERTRREGWFGRPAPDLSVDWVVTESDVLSGTDTPTAPKPMTGYPETFLVDADRRIRIRLIGPMPWDETTWERIVGNVPDLEPPADAAKTVQPQPPAPSTPVAGAPATTL